MMTTEATAELESRPAPDQAPFPPRWKRNFAANFVDSLFFSLALAFVSVTTIVPLFISSLGGSALLIGLIPALVQTGHMLPPLFTAPYVAPLPRKLPFLLKMTVIERLPLLVLAILSIRLATTNPTAMVIITASLLAIFGLGGGICLPAWMDIVARVTPLRMRGKLFGWSGALSGLLGVAGGLAAERVLAAFAFPYNFAACFAAASLCLLVSFLGLAAIHEPVAEERAEAMALGAYIGQLPVLLRRDRDFRFFIFVRVLSAFAGLATAFVAVYATEQRELPASMAGRFTSWMLGAQIIATPLFGMLADRHGYKSSLQFALLAQAVAMVLSLIVTTPLGFSIVFALMGAASGLLFAATLNMVVEFARPAERVTYLGLHGTLIALPTLLAPVIGGWLVEAGGYPLAFIVAAVFGITAFVLLTWSVRDPRHRQLAMAAASDRPL